MEETFELIMLVLQLTGWDVRVLTKSLLIRKLAERIPKEYRHRIIYGLSIGILDDGVAGLVERLTPPPSQRIKAYRELQQQGLRTYSMHCPILPQADYRAYAERLAASVNWKADELIWAEALNLRGDSMKNTIMTLKDDFPAEADLLAEVAGSRVMWETQYNRPLFEALAAVCPPGKLRFLVYPAAEYRDYWLGNRDRGAVVLGDDKFEEDEP
jgi:DNA repair photolyase